MTCELGKGGGGVGTYQFLGSVLELSYVKYCANVLLCTYLVPVMPTPYFMYRDPDDSFPANRAKTDDDAKTTFPAYVVIRIAEPIRFPLHPPMRVA